MHRGQLVNSCIVFGHLLGAVKTAARQLGLNGDPLADRPLLTGSLEQKLLTIDLFTRIPRRLREPVSDLAWQMCERTVLSHRSNADDGERSK